MTKFIILFLFITGCNFRDSVKLHSDFVIDSNFTQEEQTYIVNGVNQWEKTTDGLVKLNLIVSNQPELYGNDTGKILQSNSYVGDTAFHIYGFTNNSPNETAITIYNNTLSKDTVNFQEIITHELGHAFGLIHVTEGLMTLSPHGILCIDTVTLNNFCIKHNCDGKNIKSDCQ